MIHLNQNISNRTTRAANSNNAAGSPLPTRATHSPLRLGSGYGL